MARAVSRRLNFDPSGRRRGLSLKTLHAAETWLEHRYYPIPAILIFRQLHASTKRFREPFISCLVTAKNLSGREWPHGYAANYAREEKC